MTTAIKDTLGSRSNWSTHWRFILSHRSIRHPYESISFPCYATTTMNHTANPSQSAYFTKFTPQKFTFYVVVILYLVVASSLCFLEPLLSDDFLCGGSGSHSSTTAHTTYPNPDYIAPSPCRYNHRFFLLTRHECSCGRRLLLSVALGGLVGWERREADRPAGIRTMSLVSLGACVFTLTSMYSFRSGPMEWDASRVAAAIPSGVGFLGAGLIFKQAEKDNATGDTTHVVHGLTTAASLWIVRITS